MSPSTEHGPPRTPLKHIEVVQQGYDAWNRGDIGAVLELVDPEFEWHEASEVAGGGSVYTRDQFESYLVSLGRLWATIRLEPQEMHEVGDEVLVEVLERARGRTSGAEVTQHFTHVWSFKNRRAYRMRAYFDKGEAMRALGLADPST
jgi:ketosteroid isomerase-like protein